VLDTRIYLTAIWEFCAGPAYPFVFADLAEEMHTALRRACSRAGDGIHALETAAAEAEEFIDTARGFDRLIEAARAGELDDAATAAVDAASMRLNRLILPVT